jgi:hypothetical protein
VESQIELDFSFPLCCSLGCTVSVVCGSGVYWNIRLTFGLLQGELQLNFQKRRGHGLLSVLRPKFSGLLGEALDLSARWSGDVVSSVFFNNLENFFVMEFDFWPILLWIIICTTDGKFNLSLMVVIHFNIITSNNFDL